MKLRPRHSGESRNPVLQISMTIPKLVTSDSLDSRFRGNDWKCQQNLMCMPDISINWCLP